jgi:hypothetical protein
LAVIGYSDTRPIQPNDSEQGRNANRRVVVVILSTELQRQKAPGDEPTNALGPIPPSTDAPAAPSPDNATAMQPAATAIPVNNVIAPQPGTTLATAPARATAASTGSTAESGTPATAFPAPAAQATLVAPGEPAQLPARQAPPPPP